MIDSAGDMPLSGNSGQPCAEERKRHRGRAGKEDAWRQREEESAHPAGSMRGVRPTCRGTAWRYRSEQSKNAVPIIAKQAGKFRPVSAAISRTLAETVSATSKPQRRCGTILPEQRAGANGGLRRGSFRLAAKRPSREIDHEIDGIPGRWRALPKRVRQGGEDHTNAARRFSYSRPNGARIVQPLAQPSRGQAIGSPAAPARQPAAQRQHRCECGFPCGSTPCPDGHHRRLARCALGDNRFMLLVRPARCGSPRQYRPGRRGPSAATSYSRVSARSSVAAGFAASRATAHRGAANSGRSRTYPPIRVASTAVALWVTTFDTNLIIGRFSKHDPVSAIRPGVYFGVH